MIMTVKNSMNIFLIEIIDNTIIILKGIKLKLKLKRKENKQ